MSNTADRKQQGSAMLVVVGLGLVISLVFIAALVVSKKPFSPGFSEKLPPQKRLSIDALLDTYVITLQYDQALQQKLQTVAIEKIIEYPATLSDNPSDDYKIQLLDKQSKKIAQYSFSIPNQTINTGMLFESSGDPKIENGGRAEIVEVPQVKFALKVPALKQATAFSVVDLKGRQVLGGALMVTNKDGRTVVQPAQSQRNVLAAKDCTNAGSDICVQLKAYYNKPLKVGDPVTLQWQAYNVGKDGAVALNGPLVDRFVPAVGSYTVFMPKSGKLRYTARADSGKGDAKAVSEDSEELEVVSATQPFLRVIVLGSGYPYMGSKLLAETYDADVKRLEDGVRSFEPFKSYKGNIRFFPIDTPADELDKNKDFNFDCKRPDTKYPGLLTCSKSGTISKILSQVEGTPSSVVPVVLVNDDLFGGGLGYFNTKDRHFNPIATSPGSDKIYMVANPLVVYRGEFAPKLLVHSLAEFLGVSPELVFEKDGKPFEIPLATASGRLLANCYLPGKTDSQSPLDPATWLKLKVEGVKQGEVKQGCVSNTAWRSQDKSIMNSLVADSFSPAALTVLTQQFKEKTGDPRPLPIIPKPEERPGASPAPTVKPPVSDDQSVNGLERQIFDLTNKYRQQNGLPPFKWHDKLAQFARSRSEDMVKNRYFAHDSPTKPLQQMAQEFGLPGVGENIACGNVSAEATMQQWINSPGHNANLLRNYQYLSVGVALNGVPGYCGGYTWTQSFMY